MKRILIILAAALMLTPAALRADEGMWMLPLLEKMNADALRLKPICGVYVLKNYGSAVFDDITAKLTSLYGDVDFTYETEEGNWKGKKAKRTSNVWYGANGTMVSVSYFVGWGTTINYSYEGADELLKNASYGNLSGL